MATLQNSINAPTPIATNKGGTGIIIPGFASLAYVVNDSNPNVDMEPFIGYINYGTIAGTITNYNLPSSANVGDLFAVQGTATNYSFTVTAGQITWYNGTYDFGSVLRSSSTTGSICFIFGGGGAYSVVFTNGVQFIYDA